MMLLVLSVVSALLGHPSTDASVPPEVAKIFRTADTISIEGDAEDGVPLSYCATWRHVPRILLPPSPATGSIAGGGECSALVAAFHAVGEAPEGDHPTSAVYTPDGSTVLISHRDSQNIVRYDATTREVLGTIELSGSPLDLAVSPDGTRAVTANVDTETLSIIDLASNTEVATVAMGTMCGVVAFTADSTMAVVGNPGESSISIVDLATGSEIRRIKGTSFTMTMTFAPESGAVALDFSRFAVLGNNSIIHPSSFTDEILIIDIASGETTVLPCENWPRGIDVSDDGTAALVTHYTSPLVSVIDIANSTIDRTIDMGTNTWGPVALSGDGSKAAVAVLNATRIVTLADDSVSSSINTATVYDLLCTADGNHALGVGYYGSLISFESESLLRNVNQVISTPVGAVSPTDPLAAMAANVFGEELVFSSTDPATGDVLEARASGPDPEGDICRSVAVHSATNRVVVLNLFSRTAEVLDAATGSVVARFDTGKRPSDVCISSDGAYAVIANLDSSFATVFDMSTLTAHTVPISSRGSRVQISPDGAVAYIAVVSSGDGVWRINLDTLTTDGPKLSTGNMGSVGYAYSMTSGLVLSHDGATLATCDSFSDTVTLIDTASWTVRTAVPVSGFPTMAAFSPDDASLFVSQRNSDTVAIVDVAAGSVLESIAVGDMPGPLTVSHDGSILYLINASDKTVGIVSLDSSTMTDAIDMPFTPVGLGLDASGQCLFVATGTTTTSAGGGGYSSEQDGDIVIIDTSSAAISGQVHTEVGASALAVDPNGPLLAVASPSGDGVVILQESTSLPGDLNADGVVDGADLGLLLAAFWTEDPLADINGDSIVDGADLGLLLANWSI